MIEISYQNIDIVFMFYYVSTMESFFSKGAFDCDPEGNSFRILFEPLRC